MPVAAGQVVVSTAARLISESRARTGETRDDLAARCGLSTGLLSQLERGYGNPALSTLVKLAHGLDIPLSRFFEEAHHGQVIRAGRRPRLDVSDAGVTYELHTPVRSRRLGVVRAQLPPGWDNRSTPFVHPGEECLTLLAGELIAVIGDEEHHLTEGDSITYDSGLPHWYRNDGRAPAITLGAMTPPHF